MVAAGGAAEPTALLTDTARTPGKGATGAGRARSDRDHRWQALRAFDPGTFRKAALLRWGVDERDPTSDRRLIEFCFSLPPDQLLGGGMTRRLARVALQDRLPPTILHGPRGYQFADWYESLDRAQLGRFARRFAASPSTAQILDFSAIERLIDGWPPTDLASMYTIGAYRIDLLRALSAGAFALNADS